MTETASGADANLWILAATHSVVAIAALLQGVTGIGFALIAGPALLIALSDPSALQITALLSLLTSLVLAPRLLHAVDRGRLTRLTMVALLGLPIGAALYSVAEAPTLKLVSGLTLGALTLAIALSSGGARPTDAELNSTRTRRGDAAFAGFAGVLGGALAMPGPPIALRLSALGVGKTETRATILAFFVLFYPLIFVGQVAGAGLRLDTLWTTLTYAPAAALGALAGQAVASHVSETAFRRVVLGVLAAMSVSLLIEAL